jgi:hypothetical protein
VAILITVLTLALVVVVLLVVSAPLRAAWRSPATEPTGDQDQPGGDWHAPDLNGAPDEVEPAEDRIELETRREAKYREIRDTELDYRTGKLSKEDFAATDSALRAEAVEILDRLAALDEAG